MSKNTNPDAECTGAELSIEDVCKRRHISPARLLGHDLHPLVEFDLLLTLLSRRAA
jgi:hypothetical protein